MIQIWLAAATAWFGKHEPDHDRLVQEIERQMQAHRRAVRVRRPASDAVPADKRRAAASR